MEPTSDNIHACTNALKDTGANAAVAHGTATKGGDTCGAMKFTEKGDNNVQIHLHGAGWDASVDAFLDDVSRRDPLGAGKKPQQPHVADPLQTDVPPVDPMQAAGADTAASRAKALMVPGVCFVIFLLSFIVFASTSSGFAGFVMFMSVLTMAIYSYRLVVFSQNTVDIRSALLLRDGWAPPRASHAQHCEKQGAV